MDVRYLQYILEIGRQHSITRAAARLYVSQSSLSQYLAKLESEIGTPLFIRTKNELLPTPAGELYLEAAASVVQIQKQLYQNISYLSQTGQLVLGISSQWGLDVMTDVMPVFLKTYPHITLKLQENKYSLLVKDLEAGNLNLCLTAVPSLEDFPFPCERLRTEEILLAIPAEHHYALSHPDREPLNLSQLIQTFRQECFILSSDGSTIRLITDRLLHAQGFSPRTFSEVNSNFAAQRLVAGGMGIAFLPASYRDREPGIAYFSLSPKLTRENVLAFPKAAGSALSGKEHSRNAQEALDYLAGLIRQHPQFQNYSSCNSLG